MMDKLEQGSGNTVNEYFILAQTQSCYTICQVLSEPEAQGLLKDNPDLVLAVYDYWLSKRLRAVSILSTSLSLLPSSFIEMK